MKFLLLLLVVIGALAWLGLARRKPRARDDAAAPPAKPAPNPPPQAMLSCAHCGVHLPAPDALKDQAGRAYCSDAHRQAGPRGG
jgi:uncharacterized protein